MENQDSNAQETPELQGYTMTVTFIIEAQDSSLRPSTQYTRRNLRPLQHRTSSETSLTELSSFETFARFDLDPLFLLNLIFGQHQDISMQGQPRASEDSISSLQSLPFLSEKRRLKHEKCPICQEDFPPSQNSPQVSDPDALDESLSIIRLPCHHLFHKHCVHRWLKMSCTCPSCRYELLTENEEYNVGVRERMAVRNSELGIDTDEEDDYASDKTILPQSKKRKDLEITDKDQRKKAKLCNDVEPAEADCSSSSTCSNYNLRSQKNPSK